jgi:hypothetical protein
VVSAGPAKLLQRVARLLTWRRTRAYALILVVLYLVAWVSVIVTGDPPINSGGAPMAGDYIAFHTAGRLVLSGRAAEMYSHDAVVALQDELLGGRIPHFYDAFRNPPFVALLYAPFAALDLLWGFAMWCLFGLACLALALRLLLAETPWLKHRWRGLLIFIWAFPPVYFGFIDGENALLSLLLFALIYRALARNQHIQLGVWMALGLFKPQLFFVFPLILLTTRRWKALTAYIATAVALLAISVALVGPAGMQAWLRILIEPEGGNATVNGWRMTSAKSFFDILFPGYSPLSLAVYGVVSVVLLVAMTRLWARRDAPIQSVWAFTCLVAVLVDPHLVDYDLTVLVSAGIIAASLVPKLLWAIVPLYVVTLLRAQIPLGDVAALQLAPPLLIACGVAVWRAATQPASHNRSEFLASWSRKYRWFATRIASPRRPDSDESAPNRSRLDRTCHDGPSQASSRIGRRSRHCDPSGAGDPRLRRMGSFWCRVVGR